MVYSAFLHYTRNFVIIIPASIIINSSVLHYYDELTGILIASGNDATPDEGYFINMAKDCLDLQNQIRAESGLAALSWDEELYQDIKIRGPEIAEYFSHTSLSFRKL